MAVKKVSNGSVGIKSNMEINNSISEFSYNGTFIYFQ